MNLKENPKIRVTKDGYEALEQGKSIPVVIEISSFGAFESKCGEIGFEKQWETIPSVIDHEILKSRLNQQALSRGEAMYRMDVIQESLPPQLC